MHLSICNCLAYKTAILYGPIQHIFLPLWFCLSHSKCQFIFLCHPTYSSESSSKSLIFQRDSTMDGFSSALPQHFATFFFFFFWRVLSCLVMMSFFACISLLPLSPQVSLGGQDLVLFFFRSFTGSPAMLFIGQLFTRYLLNELK